MSLYIGPPRSSSDEYAWIGLEDARDAAVAAPIDVVYVALELPASATASLVVGLRTPPHGPPPRLIGVGNWEHVGEHIAGWELDAVVIGEQPRVPWFLAPDSSSRLGRARVLERLLSLSFIGADAAATVARELRLGFAATECAVWLSAGDLLALVGTASDRGDRPEPRELARRVASCGAIVVDGDHAYVGAGLRTNGGDLLGALCLGVASGAPLPDRDLLEKFAARAGAELRLLSQRKGRAATAGGTDDAIHDRLGIYSRSFVDDLLAREIARSVRSGHPLGVAVVEVVDLESIDLRHGQPVADEVMRALDRVVRGVLRESDVVGRHGDDSLAVIVPETGLEATIAVLTRIRDLIAARGLALAGFDQPLELVVQIGVATLELRDDAAALLVRAAAAARTPGEVHAADAPDPELADSASVPPLEPGHVVANTYRILHLIGEGGVGLVYRAEDVTLQRPVALKVLRPELARDATFLARFRTEATLLASVQHPNLVQVFSFGEAADAAYFAMELVEGETLADAMMREHRKGVFLPLERVLSCMAQIAAALDCLHHAGVLHRDVKPDNIGLDPFRERAVLIDVGVAKRVDLRGEAAGTPGFVAPEVLYRRGESAASDVFSLAVTVFQALTYRNPWASFETAPTQIIADAGEPPRLLSQLRPELAAADPILMRGLSYDPSRRPQSAGELVRLLVAALGPQQLAELADPTRVSGRLNVAGPLPGGIQVDGPTLVEIELATPTTPQTRGVVFRAMSRSVATRALPSWLDELTRSNAAVGSVLSPELPGLSWCDAGPFFDLLAAAECLGAPGEDLARRFGRAVIRSSFQRLFPASTSTLVPERIVAAYSVVWAKYQSWGRMTSVVSGSHGAITIDDVPRLSAALGWWIEGLVAQTVVLCGGEDVSAKVVQAGNHTLGVEVAWRPSRWVPGTLP